MRYISILVLTLVFISCKHERKKDIHGAEHESIVKTNDRDTQTKEIAKTDFNAPPISIKEYTLNEKDFWVTSSMIDSKYLDTLFCPFRDYKFLRKYNIISKTNIDVINNLEVYVQDNEHKWNREKAEEEFLSIEINNKSIKAWDIIFVGMSTDSLVRSIDHTEYHLDYGVADVYSIDFTSHFYFEKNKITKIIVRRNCKSQYE